MLFRFSHWMHSSCHFLANGEKDRVSITKLSRLCPPWSDQTGRFFCSWRFPSLSFDHLSNPLLTFLHFAGHIQGSGFKKLMYFVPWQPPSSRGRRISSFGYWKIRAHSFRGLGPIPKKQGSLNSHSTFLYSLEDANYTTYSKIVMHNNRRRTEYIA